MLLPPHVVRSCQLSPTHLGVHDVVHLSLPHILAAVHKLGAAVVVQLACRGAGVCVHGVEIPTVDSAAASLAHEVQPGFTISSWASQMESRTGS